MYSADFDYYRANSVAEAVRLLTEHPGAKLLAGGHSLIPLLKLRLSRPSALVDIGPIGALRGIGTQNGTLHIGALTTHADIASSSIVQNACPMLAEAAAVIGDPHVRNRGTIGGNAAHADPASDLPAVLTALGASFTAVGPGGEQTIAAGDFFQGLLTTALGDDQVLTAILVPIRQQGQGMAYVKFSHPASRYAVVGAAASVTVQDGRCQQASVALSGLVPTPARASAVEGALTGSSLTAQVIADAAGRVEQDLGDDVLEDVFASADYRKAMAQVYLRQALTEALQRATG